MLKNTLEIDLKAQINAKITKTCISIAKDCESLANTIKYPMDVDNTEKTIKYIEEDLASMQKKLIEIKQYQQMTKDNTEIVAK